MIHCPSFQDWSETVQGKLGWYFRCLVGQVLKNFAPVTLQIFQLSDQKIVSSATQTVKIIALILPAAYCHACILILLILVNTSLQISVQADDEYQCKTI